MLVVLYSYRIGPFEVESALLEHHAVMESAVVSSPDKERGEVIQLTYICVLVSCEKDIISSFIKNQITG